MPAALQSCLVSGWAPVWACPSSLPILADSSVFFFAPALASRWALQASLSSDLCASRQAPMWVAPRQNLCLSFLHSPAANAVAGISKAIIATVKCFMLSLPHGLHKSKPVSGLLILERRTPETSLGHHPLPSRSDSLAM